VCIALAVQCSSFNKLAVTLSNASDYQARVRVIVSSPLARLSDTL